MKNCIGLRIGNEEIPIDQVVKINIRENGVCDVKYFAYDYGFIYKEIKARTELDYLEFIYGDEEE